MNDDPSSTGRISGDAVEPADRERLLLERNERLKLALDAANMSTWTMDLATLGVTVGPDFRRILGLDAGRPVDEALLARLPEEEHRRLRASFENAMRTGARFEAEAQFAGDDGEPRWIATQAIVIRGDDGAPVKALGVVTDVTARVEAERERERLLERAEAARAQAEAAARARDEFLAIVSHELRSPLNAIQSWAHVIETQIDAKASPLAHRALTGVRTGVDQQVRLIEDLLDATRIMTGKLSLKRAPLAVRPVVEAAVGSVRAQAEARRVNLSAELDVRDEQIDGDRDRVQQILWNLLTNAVKFTAEGGSVEVRAFADGTEVAVRIRDDGKGIEPAYLPHIFDRFSRFERASKRGHDGLGLGLALVKHLCALHGGAVSAESDGPGRGATFTVRFPLLAARHGAILGASDPATVAPPSNALAGLRVLLIDDQAEARDAVSAVLEHAGAAVVGCASGKAALDHLESLEAPWPLDVLISDIAMPEEDGYTTLARVRVREQRLGDGRTLPAIALTAFAHADDRMRALEAGFELHLAKPAAADELIAAVAACAGRIIGAG